MSERQSKKSKKLRQEHNQFIGRLSRKNTKQPEPVMLYGGAWTGWWNGEAVTFTVVTVKINERPETPLSWQNAFNGQERQAIHIDYKGQVFLIDNATGQGLYKVTAGKGLPNVGHSSISADCTILSMVDKENWQYPDKEKHKADHDTYIAYCQQNHPEEYAKLMLAQKNWDESPMNPLNIKK